MDAFVLTVISLTVLGLIVFTGILYALYSKPEKEYARLMSRGDSGVRNRPRIVSDEEIEVERIKKITGYSKEQRQVENVAKKLYRAGYFAEVHRKYFLALQILSIIVWPLLVYLLSGAMLDNELLSVITVILGVFVGYTMPLAWLNRQIEVRREDTLYYLPIVIEQISIGVSGSLDIGPCIAQIVETAQERDSHNPVTEMFVHAEKLIRAGLNLEDALLEVSEANGMNEVKHAFMFLVQCAKHGGEISRQLQELADSVMAQRQVQVEGKITALPVKATGPLATVFAGFFGLLFAGLFVRLATAFG